VTVADTRALRSFTADEAVRRMAHRRTEDHEAEAAARTIVDDVRRRGAAAALEHARRFGDVRPDTIVVHDRASSTAALAALPADARGVLERTAERIRRFAEAQRTCLLPLDLPIAGGRAGHRWQPVASAGAYAPGGRHPLPSSVLMTVIPAVVAGVPFVAVASPRPTQVTLAAAAVAGADRLIAIGGAQAIAALAFGCFGPAANTIVGPGNRYVTAAKRVLAGDVGIDGLAGPSELLVLADGTADPDLVAADLLAQAEHDVDAAPWLVTTDGALAARVAEAVEHQLVDLPTAHTARAAMHTNGGVVIAADRAEATALANTLAPEHLELCVADPDAWRSSLTDYGALFVGAASAEVLGDYGAGPNHVLPTGGTSRFTAGLSVVTFLRAQTYLDIAPDDRRTADAIALARLEGLEAHARAAERRLRGRR
jgi:histidinol dehydrogenase